MRIAAWLVLGWAATLAGAYALGRTQAPPAPEPLLVEPAVMPAAAPRAPAAVPQPAAAAVEERPAPRLASAPAAAPAAPAPAPAPASTQLVLPAVRVVAASEPLALEGHAHLVHVVERLLAYAAAQLGAGTDGHRALYRQLGHVLGRNGRLRVLVRDEEAALPFAYPMLRFVVERDAQVLAMLETLLETAARDPGFYRDDPSDDVLEMFVQGVGVVACGVLEPAQRERLAGYVRAILAQPEAEQPKSLRGVRSELEQLLVLWLPQSGRAEALERLRAGGIAPREALRLLRRLAPSERATLDVPALVGPWLAAGEVTVAWEAGSLGLSAEEVEALDRWALRGMGEGTLPEHVALGWLSSTRRRDWQAARPFVLRALAQGSPVADCAARLLRHLHVGAQEAESLLAGVAMDPALRERVLRDLAR
ncbi:MAG: hypothetical protein ACKOSS_03530 [Planctomycetia bacterium]